MRYLLRFPSSCRGATDALKDQYISLITLFISELVGTPACGAKRISAGAGLIRILLTGLFCSIALIANAADLPSVRLAACWTSPDSQILELKRADLVSTLTNYRDDAVAASTRQSVVFSRSVAFDWAVAATVQCNVALGYLEGGHVDKSSAQKCDCFHGHMLALE